MATKNAAKIAKKNARAAARRAQVNPHAHGLPTEMVAEMHAHRRSGAAGVHANSADRRARTRAGSKARAIREWA